MSKVTKIQRLVLVTAAGRDHLGVLPLPDTLGSAPEKVIAGLHAAGFIIELPNQDPVISRSGLEAIGAEPTDYQNSILARIEEEGQASSAQKEEPTGKSKPRSKHRRPEKKTQRSSRIKARRKGEHQVAPGKDTKQAKLIGMLSRPSGATIEQMAKTLGWQHHTVRGAIAGALKKKLGLKIASEKNTAGNRVYRVVGAR
jgi:hypothetical protein